MTRTFIALEMNEDAQRHLAEVIRQMTRVLSNIRWVNPSGIHLTLAFLGELTDEQLTKAAQATEIAASNVNQFSYSLSRIGIFGPPNNPRVLWMGINEPSGILERLHSTLNKELIQQGFQVDARPFSPHLTLARIKAPLAYNEQQNLQNMLKQQRSVASRAYHVRHIDVMKSELMRTGAKYTCLKECSLVARRKT